MEVMFNTLFNAYLQDLDKDKEQSLVVQYYHNMTPEYQRNNSRERVALDYISGMTTNYFKNEYKKELVRARTQ